MALVTGRYETIDIIGPLTSAHRTRRRVESWRHGLKHSKWTWWSSGSASAARRSPAGSPRPGCRVVGIEHTPGRRRMPLLGLHPDQDDDPRRQRCSPRRGGSPAWPGRPQVQPDWAPVARRIRDEATDNWDDKVAVDRFAGKGGAVRPRAGPPSPARAGSRSASRSTRPRRGVVIATGTAPVDPADRRARRHAVLDQPGRRRGRDAARRRCSSSAAARSGSSWRRCWPASGCRSPSSRAATGCSPWRSRSPRRSRPRRLAADGVKILTGVRREHVAHSGDGFAVTLTDGPTRHRREAAGRHRPRRPNLDGLGLDTSASTRRARFLAIDERMRAGDRLWAVGDVTGHGAFTHMAMYEADVAVRDILGQGGPPADYRALPRVTFTDPEIGAVGLTEQQARDAGVDVQVGYVELPSSSRGFIHGPGNEGFIKLIADRDARGAGRRHLGRARPAARCSGALSVAVHGRGPGGDAARHHLGLPDVPPGDRRRAASALESAAVAAMAVRRSGMTMRGAAVVGRRCRAIHSPRPPGQRRRRQAPPGVGRIRQARRRQSLTSQCRRAVGHPEPQPAGAAAVPDGVAGQFVGDQHHRFARCAGRRRAATCAATAARNAYRLSPSKRCSSQDSGRRWWLRRRWPAAAARLVGARRGQRSPLRTSIRSAGTSAAPATVNVRSIGSAADHDHPARVRQVRRRPQDHRGRAGVDEAQLVQVEMDVAVQRAPPRRAHRSVRRPGCSRARRHPYARRHVLPADPQHRVLVIDRRRHRPRMHPRRVGQGHRVEALPVVLADRGQPPAAKSLPTSDSKASSCSAFACGRAAQHMSAVIRRPVRPSGPPGPARRPSSSTMVPASGPVPPPQSRSLVTTDSSPPASRPRSSSSARSSSTSAASV